MFSRYKINHRGWSDLPEYFLEEFFVKLDVINDQVSFGAVCTTWQSVYHKNRQQQHSQHQLGLLKVNVLQPEEDNTIAFLNVVQNRVYRFKSPKRFSVCVPCSNLVGWVLIVTGSGLLCTSVYLLNPLLLSNTKIKIPALYLSGCPHKFVLSADPSSTSDYFIVALICIGYNRPAIFKSGEKHWSLFPWPLEDITYYNHWFYGIMDHVYEENPNPNGFRQGDILAFQVSRTKNASDLAALERLRVYDPRWFRKRCFIESEGRLLLVHRVLGEGCCTSSRMVRFEVFELDDRFVKKWTSTNNLGSCNLFIGERFSMSLPASDLPECKSNGIHFNFLSGCLKPHESGVFNLETNEFVDHQFTPVSQCIRFIIFLAAVFVFILLIIIFLMYRAYQDN